LTTITDAGSRERQRQTRSVGVVTGRFNPFHAGHETVIRTGRQLVGTLHVAVADLPDETIPADRRCAWIEQTLPGIRAHHVGVAPARYAPDSEKVMFWARALRESFGRVDRIIGSQPITHELAVAIGAHATVLDPYSFAIPVRSAEIRAAPNRHWQFLPRAVRTHFQKRLTLVGPESTGKSTVAARLASDFGGPVVPEFGRPFEVFRQSGGYRAWELVEIARTHVAHRRALAGLAGPVVFEDTDPLLTAVWAEMLLGHSVPEVEALIELPDRYLLLDTDMEWTDDPLRYFAATDERARFFALIRAKLDRYGASYAVVSGSMADRIATASAEAERLGACRPNGAGPHP
jgi:NadR type nicotinamide-nucleotide adenylyltransferase